MTALSLTTPAHARLSTDQRCSPSDQLVKRIGQGDKLAMHELYVMLRTRVYRFILRIVRNPTVAEDLVAAVFLDVWTQAARYQGRSSASTWVLSIARNKALTILRKQARKEVDIENAAQVADPSDDAEVVLQKQSNSAILRNCLRSLPAHHSEIIDLVYYQNRSIKEVAAIVAIPENTVKSRMHLARKRLAQMLTGAGFVRVAS